MHPEHAKLLKDIRAAAGGARPEVDHYGGSGHRLYGLSVPVRRAIARAWTRQNAMRPAAEVFEVMESLLSGPSHEEKTLAALLLSYHGSARAAVKPGQLTGWLDRLNGWSEVDSLCQSMFPAEQLLAAWPAWRAALRRLGAHANINHRRASLVLLTGPVHGSADPRLAELAFERIAVLQHAREILITKAISWLMRTLVRHHARALRAFMAEHEATLPKIALRETRTKLDTGRKTPRADGIRAKAARARADAPRR